MKKTFHIILSLFLDAETGAHSKRISTWLGRPELFLVRESVSTHVIRAETVFPDMEYKEGMKTRTHGRD